MPGRNYSAGSEYRYGFNGKERDKEAAGTTTYDYGFRIYSPALGKFLSVDPLTQSYPWYTPYQFAGNKPVVAIDLDGLEEFIKTNWYDVTGNIFKTEITINEQGPMQSGAYVKTINNYINSEGQIGFIRGSQDYLSALDFSNKMIGHPNTRNKLSFDTEKHDNAVYGNNFDVKNSLFSEFSNGTGSENTVIYGGKMLDEIKSLPSVKSTVKFAYLKLQDQSGNAKAGDVITMKHTMKYSEGFFSIFIPSFFRGGAKDYTGNPENNPLVSTRHFLGSFTLTGSVLDDGQTIMWTLADSKTQESLTDQIGTSVKREDGKKVPNGSTFQRYIWFEKLQQPPKKLKIKPTYSDNTELPKTKPVIIN